MADLGRGGREARERMEAAARHKVVGEPKSPSEREIMRPSQIRGKLYDRIKLSVKTMDVIIWCIVGLIIAAVVIGVIIGP